MTGKLAWLCEGEPDCICARSRGLEAYTLTGGAGSWDEELGRFLAGREVVICYDADLAGLIGARKVAGKLARAAASVRILRWPESMTPDGPGQDSTKDAKRREQALAGCLDAAGEDYARRLPAKAGLDLTDWFVTLEKSVQKLHGLLQEAEPGLAPADAGEPEGPMRFFRVSLQGRPSFASALLAQEILEDTGLVTERDSRVSYRWNGRFFQEVLIEDLEHLALAKLEDQADISKARNSVAQAIAHSMLPPGEEMNLRKELLCLPNGMLDLDTLELSPHDKAHRATYMFPWEFDPHRPADCPRTKRYFWESIGNEGVIREVQEFAGYVLYPWCNFEKALFLIGKPGSGKGTLLDVLRGLAGPENTSSVDLMDMDSEFARAMLHNKALNVFHEADERMFSKKYFNAITSGNPLAAAHKHKDFFDMVPRCKLGFSMTRFRRPFGAHEDFFDRVLPVHYGRKFRHTDQQDPYLKEKLLAELPGIFAWAVVGLCRLRARGGFMPSPATTAFLARYRSQANPVQAFIEECCEVGQEKSEIKNRVYGVFKVWCKQGERRPMANNKFWEEVWELVPQASQTRRPRSEGRAWVVKGLSVHDDAPQPE